MKIMLLIVNVLTVLIDLTYCFLFFEILRSFLIIRKQRFLQIIAFIFSFFLSTMAIYPQDIINLIGTFIGFCIFVTIFSCSRWEEKLASVLIFYPILIAINYLMLNVSSQLFFFITGFSQPENSWTEKQLLISSLFYIVAILMRLLFWLCTWLLLKKYLQQMKTLLTTKMWIMVDILMLSAFVAIVSIILAFPKIPIVAYPICLATIISSFGCIYLISYICHSMHVEQNARELKLQQLNLKDRMEEEHRIRSIYHDMKNHLLIIQEKFKDRKESIQLINSIHREMEEYEHYYHTGNAFLDIIIRDKARQCQDKEIDFFAFIQFNDGNFMDALDISTIFGNALDNAIEACEKISADMRIITIKAVRVHNMLSINIENSFLDAPKTSKTSKKDAFLHGFGRSNIKRSVEKYDGECSTTAENGIYKLSLIIPIPQNK